MCIAKPCPDLISVLCNTNKSGSSAWAANNDQDLLAS